MTLTPHGEPRCECVATSQWGTARCVLPEGHTGRHAYGPTEGEGAVEESPSARDRIWDPPWSAS